MKKTLNITLIFLLMSVCQSAMFPAAADGGQTHSSETGKSQAQGDLPEVVTLTDAQVVDRGIVVVPAPVAAIDDTVSAPGTVQFVPGRICKIGPRLTAKVVKMTVNLGDRVQAGDVVALLDSVELGKVKVRYIASRATMEVARTAYEREKRLALQKITSQAELQQARANFEQAQAELNGTVEELRLYGLSQAEIGAIQENGRHPFSRYALTADQSGIVEQLDVTPGQTLTPDMTPIEIVDPARMWIVIEAFEQDSGHIKPGALMVFKPRALPNVEFQGKVDWVAQELSPNTRTLQVIATVANEDDRLKAGMFGTAYVATAESAKQVVLPVDAVQTIDGRPIVFKPVGDHPNTFAIVQVTTGKERANQVSILAGVTAGEPIVIKGAFALAAVLTAGSRIDTD